MQAGITHNLYVLLLLFCLQLSVCFASQAPPPFRNNGSSLVFDFVTNEEFQKYVIEQQHLWIVIFYKNDKHINSQFTPIWELIANRVRGMVRVGAADVSEVFGSTIIKQVGSGVPKLPFVLLFPSVLFTDPKKYGAVPYNGELKVDSVASWALKQIPTQLVMVIDTEEKALALPKYTDFPAALYFTAKDSTPPLYRALSLDFVQRMNFIEVRNSKVPDVAKSYGVSEFPAILVLTAAGAEPIVYEGGAFQIEPLQAFLHRYARTDEEVEELKRKHEQKAKGSPEQKKQQKEEEKDPLNPTVRIHTNEMWNQLVLEKGGISLVALLDCTQSNHLEVLVTLKKVWQRNKRGGTKFNFVWIDGIQQHQLSEYFGVVHELPSIVFVNAKKNWSKLFVGAFSETGIWSFSQNQLLKGAVKPLDLASLPAFVEEDNADGLHELVEEVKESGKAEEEQSSRTPQKSQEKKSEKKTPVVEKKLSEAALKSNAEREASRKAEREAIEAEKLRLRKEREDRLLVEKEENLRLLKEKKKKELLAEKLKKEKIEAAKNKKSPPSSPTKPAPKTTKAEPKKASRSSTQEEAKKSSNDEEETGESFQAKYFEALKKKKMKTEDDL